MDLIDVFAIPQRSKLRFGEPVEEVFEGGTLHSGLKDLFSKAYLSAREDEQPGDASGSREVAREPLVLAALRPGPDGQGSLAQRLSLKARAEAGEWLIPARTPAGAPLWLLRHFLGRLPRPLLEGSHWRALGAACGAALYSPDPESKAHFGEVLERIAVSIKALSQPEFKIFVLLTLLISKLSLQKCPIEEEEFDQKALNALSQYFIASIIVRPFRPGLSTAIDRKCQPLLVFFSKYWSIIFQEVSKVPISSSLISKEINFSDTLSEKVCEYFKNHSLSLDDHNEEHDKSIGFESLLIQQNRSKGNFDIDTNTECLRNSSLIDESKTITSDLVSDQISTERQFSKEKQFFVHFTDDNSITESDLLDNNFINECKVKNNFEDNDTVSHEINSNKEQVLEMLYKNEQDINKDYKSNAIKNPFLRSFIRHNLVSRSTSCRDITKSCFTKVDEFYSLQNSEDSQ